MKNNLAFCAMVLIISNPIMASSCENIINKLMKSTSSISKTSLPYIKSGFTIYGGLSLGFWSLTAGVYFYKIDESQDNFNELDTGLNANDFSQTRSYILDNYSNDKAVHIVSRINQTKTFNATEIELLKYLSENY